MQRILTLLFCFALVLTFAACGGDAEAEDKTKTDKNTSNSGGGGTPDINKALGDLKKAVTPPEGFVNAMCPIMGKAVDPKDGGSAPWADGKKVGFCCPGCSDKWNALTDDEKTAKLAQ